MDAVEFDAADPLITEAARWIYWGHFNRAKAAGRNPPVEYDDCYQEGWVAYLESREDFSSRLDDPRGRTYIKVSVRNHISRYARKEKAARAGYEVEDEHFYSARAIRDLLPFALAEPVPAAEAGGNILEPPVGTSRHCELIDIRRAVDQLRDDDRDVLWQMYGPTQDVPEDVPGEVPEDVPDRDIRKRASRAVGRLRDAINGMV